MINATRRGFLAAMAASIAGATFDPERLLWKPGAKLISIPKPQRISGWADNTQERLKPGDVFTIAGFYLDPLYPTELRKFVVIGTETTLPLRLAIEPLPNG